MNKEQEKCKWDKQDGCHANACYDYNYPCASRDAGGNPRDVSTSTPPQLGDEEILEAINAEDRDFNCGAWTEVDNYERAIARAAEANLLAWHEADKAKAVKAARKDTFEEVKAFLGIDMNGMGFVEISNHVDFGDWLALQEDNLRHQCKGYTEAECEPMYSHDSMEIRGMR